ncbi:MAG: N-acetylmuramoyl-L-alanine amidase [Flavobacteriales bacterium]|nr:N-acetylmuramoyl-L-alanine amidase [Flavobacteriales bacterium]
MIKYIVLDFGHGGIDENGNYTTRGKKHTFPNGETAYEGVINRRIGGMVRAFLRMLDDDYTIITTVDENDPRDLSLSYRVRVANQYPASQTLFISIHNNAFNSRARGFEIYTTRGVTRSDALAESIANAIEPFYKDLQLKLRYDLSDGDKDKEAEFYVLRRTACPAVLLECLFFDNAEDFALLKDPEFVKDLSWRIFVGIRNYLEANR